MFGRKQELTKGLEDQLRDSQEQLKYVLLQMSKAEKNGRSMAPYFETQIEAQNEMDKELTKVVGYARDTMAANDESAKVFEQIALEIGGMREQMGEQEEARIELQKSLRSQKEQMQDAVRANGRFTTPMKFLQQVQGGLTSDVEEANQLVKQMKGCAKQMSVLSLNCAIEAGRMGECGEQFIGAAEDVRRLSGDYEKTAESVERHLAGMAERVRQLEQQVNDMAKYLEENNTAMSDMTEIYTQKEQMLGRTVGKAYLDKLEAIADWLKEIAGNHETIYTLQEKTLSEMENIGGSFINEQEARKELERVYSMIMNNLSGY